MASNVHDDHTSARIDQGQAPYPFVLKTVSPNGLSCSLCRWNKFCLGCVLEKDDHLYSGNSMTLSIDWDARVQHLYFQRDEEFKIHEVRTYDIAFVFDDWLSCC